MRRRGRGGQDDSARRRQLEGQLDQLAGRVAESSPAQEVQEGSDETGRVGGKEQDAVGAAARADAAMDMAYNIIEGRGRRGETAERARGHGGGGFGCCGFAVGLLLDGVGHRRCIGDNGLRRRHGDGLGGGLDGGLGHGGGWFGKEKLTVSIEGEGEGKERKMKNDTIGFKEGSMASYKK